MALDNKELLLVSLLEKICGVCDSDNGLFTNICTYLHQIGVLENSLSYSDSQKVIRDLYGAYMLRLIGRYQEQKALPPASSSTSPDLSLSTTMTTPTSISIKNINVNFSQYLMNFIELEKIGSGAFGHVWKAYNRIDGRQYAVKKIAFPNANDPNNIRAFNEVRCLAELEHKNIARYYTAWLELSDLPLDEDEDEDETTDSDVVEVKPSVYPVMYIQMELCTMSLRDYLVARNYSGKVGDMTLEKQMIHGLIDGLRCIHQHGILHRDLTPKNIFLNGQMIPKIGDFGMAIRGNDPTTDNRMPSDCGVALYRPPDDEYTRKSDVYSMGLIFFEILSYFQTDMERYKVIDNLRKGLYPKSNFPTYIYQMIQTDPDLRPDIEDIVEQNHFSLH